MRGLIYIIYCKIPFVTMDEATVILVICIGAIGLAIRAFETAFLVIVSLSQLIEDHL